MEFAGANDINGKTGGWVSGRLRINFGGDLIHQNANRKWAKPAMLAITQRQSNTNLLRKPSNSMQVAWLTSTQSCSAVANSSQH